MGRDAWVFLPLKWSPSSWNTWEQLLYYLEIQKEQVFSVGKIYELLHIIDWEICYFSVKNVFEENIYFHNGVYVPWPLKSSWNNSFLKKTYKVNIQIREEMQLKSQPLLNYFGNKCWLRNGSIIRSCWSAHAKEKLLY